MACLWGRIKKKTGGEDTKIKKVSTDMDPEYIDYTSDDYEQIEFTPHYKLEENQIFILEVTEDIKATISNSSILELSDENTTRYDQLEKIEWKHLDYLVYNEGELLYFQRVVGRKYLKKKKVLDFYETTAPILHEREEGISIEPGCDFIFDKEDNKLYFKDFSSVSKVLKGFDSIYREATQAEIDNFLNSDLIVTPTLDTTKVTPAKRKRIALAVDKLQDFDATQKSELVAYGKKYHGGVFNVDDQILVQDSKDVDTALQIIFENFYTSEVTSERREANSTKTI